MCEGGDLPGSAGRAVLPAGVGLWEFVNGCRTVVRRDSPREYQAVDIGSLHRLDPGGRQRVPPSQTRPSSAGSAEPGGQVGKRGLTEMTISTKEGQTRRRQQTSTAGQGPARRRPACWYQQTAQDEVVDRRWVSRHRERVPRRRPTEGSDPLARPDWSPPRNASGSWVHLVGNMGGGWQSWSPAAPKRSSWIAGSYVGQTVVR